MVRLPACSALDGLFDHVPGVARLKYRPLAEQGPAGRPTLVNLVKDGQLGGTVPGLAEALQEVQRRLAAGEEEQWEGGASSSSSSGGGWNKAKTLLQQHQQQRDRQRLRERRAVAAIAAEGLLLLAQDALEVNMPCTMQGLTRFDHRWRALLGNLVPGGCVRPLDPRPAPKTCP
jgi:hypothetical protein